MPVMWSVADSGGDGGAPGEDGREGVVASVPGGGLLPVPGYRGGIPTKRPLMSNFTGGNSLKKAGTTAVVTQRNYFLNDVGALKKKLSQESNKEAFSQGKEAKDGSNFTVQMRASVFERVKEGFIQDLSKDENVVKIENGLAATVGIGN